MTKTTTGSGTSTGDFAWNGEYEVWSILSTPGAKRRVNTSDAMGALMEENGFTYVKKDAEGDPTKQVGYVEQAIAAGNVGCLMIDPINVDILRDVCAQAEAAGIAVVMLDAEPVDYTIAGGVYTAYDITGMYDVDAIARYCEVNGLDLADYGVFPCYAEDATFLEMYKEVSVKPSSNAIKGYSTHGDAPETDADGKVIKDTPTLTGEHLAEALLGVCGVGGYTWNYGEFYYDTVTAVNVCGFEKVWQTGDENPAIEYKTHR